MENEWGPWIEHDGKGCPCMGMYVHVVLSCGEQYEVVAHTYRLDGVTGRPISGGSFFVDLWDHSMCALYDRWERRVTRYRIRKPRGMTILKEIVRNPEKELEYA